MKHVRISILVIGLSLLLIAGTAAAAPSICANVVSGTENEFCGIIIAISSSGEGGGITIDVGGVGEVFVNGLGPTSFWLDAGVDRPKVGDEVCVVVMTVLAKNILMSLTYSDGTTIDVRDPATGCPNWWKGNLKQNNGKMNGKNG